MLKLLESFTDKSDFITHVFISDLHLSPIEPASSSLLGQAFLELLEYLANLPNLQQLYILGDWFEVWLGDDVTDTDILAKSLDPILYRLTKIRANHCQIFIMHGNRDFLIGQKFCDKFGGMLIREPFFISLNGKKIRLEHGDALCTDDKKYQRFRSIIRNPFIKKFFLALPIQKRKQIALNLRQKSKAGNAKKSMQIMDVNEQTVLTALDNSDIMIHGHTHRPAVHSYPNSKKRIVLGDWRTDKHRKNTQITAEIVIYADELILLPIVFEY